MLILFPEHKPKQSLPERTKQGENSFKDTRITYKKKLIFPGTAEKNSSYKLLARKIEAVEGGLWKLLLPQPPGSFWSPQVLFFKKISPKYKLTEVRQNYTTVKQKKDYLSGRCPTCTLSGSNNVA